MLLASGAALALMPLKNAFASEEATTTAAAAAPVVAASSIYQDAQDGFSVTVPTGWGFGEGSLSGNSSFSGASGERRTLAWFPEAANARDINVTITITNVSVEFTKMGSFGTPYTFGSTLVNGQDRSYLLRSPEWARGKEPIQVAKLLDAKEVSNKYFVEYTIQKLPEPQRHLYSVFALGYNGRYNRLYTITAQAVEADRPKYEAVLLSMVNSLKVPPQAR